MTLLHQHFHIAVFGACKNYDAYTDNGKIPFGFLCTVFRLPEMRKKAYNSELVFHSVFLYVTLTQFT